MGSILIVDDHPGMMQVLKATLSEAGFNVRGATRADEAVAAASDWKPDLVITDWLMSNGKDGVYVAETLTKQYPDLRVIFLTGCPVKELQSRAQGLPSARFLQKPMSLKVLLGEVQSAMDSLRREKVS